MLISFILNGPSDVMSDLNGWVCRRLVTERRRPPLAVSPNAATILKSDLQSRSAGRSALDVSAMEQRHRVHRCRTPSVWAHRPATLHRRHARSTVSACARSAACARKRHPEERILAESESAELGAVLCVNRQAPQGVNASNLHAYRGEYRVPQRVAHR